VPLAKLAADHAADSTVIHHLLKEYTPVVDTVDLKPLAQFWCNSSRGVTVQAAPSGYPLDISHCIS
jgi:hypothetical protein